MRLHLLQYMDKDTVRTKSPIWNKFNVMLHIYVSLFESIPYLDNKLNQNKRLILRKLYNSCNTKLNNHVPLEIWETYDEIND